MSRSRCKAALLHQAAVASTTRRAPRKNKESNKVGSRGRSKHSFSGGTQQANIALRSDLKEDHLLFGIIRRASDWMRFARRPLLR